MPKKDKTKEEHWHTWCCCCGGSGRLFWGIIILLIGLWILAKNLGLITINISIWAIVLIFIGLWLLLRPKNRC